MNEFLIVANLKSELLPKYIAPYLKEIEFCNSNLVICPSSIYVPYFLKHNYSVGIQNIYYDGNLYSGEITPSQAYGLGVKYVILGHSDRRSKFNETDYDINKTIIECLKCGLKVILCIGETLEEKSMLKTVRVLKKQLTLDLRNINDLDNIYIAYEPVWAIGSGNTPSNQDIKDTVTYIKEIVHELYEQDIKVLYGGSVDENNIEMIKKIPNINGVVIGKASLKPKQLLKIIEKT